MEGGGGGRVGDKMHGWASVGHGVDKCLRYNTAHPKKATKKKRKKRKKNNRQTKYKKTKRESRVTKDHSTKYVVSLC